MKSTLKGLNLPTLKLIGFNPVGVENLSVIDPGLSLPSSLRYDAASRSNPGLNDLNPVGIQKQSSVPNAATSLHPGQ
jgi:hypothetical protein